MAGPFLILLRKLLLIGNALTFLTIAAYALVATDKAASVYGYTLVGLDGHNEFRAVYIGFWMGLSILFFTAARRVEQPLLGDMGLMMVLLQSCGRILSFVLDGIPTLPFVIIFFLEFGSSVIGLLIRPGRYLAAATLPTSDEARE